MWLENTVYFFLLINLMNAIYQFFNFSWVMCIIIKKTYSSIIKNFIKPSLYSLKFY